MMKPARRIATQTRQRYDIAYRFLRSIGIFGKTGGNILTVDQLLTIPRPFVAPVSSGNLQLSQRRESRSICTRLVGQFLKPFQGFGTDVML